MTGLEWLMFGAAVALVFIVTIILLYVRLAQLPDPSKYGGGRGMQFAQPHRHPDVRPAGSTIKPPPQSPHR
jgi:hypothetical protein